MFTYINQSFSSHENIEKFAYNVNRRILSIMSLKQAMKKTPSQKHVHISFQLSRAANPKIVYRAKVCLRYVTTHATGQITEK